MNLTAEKAFALTKFICADKERAKELLRIDPVIAAQRINEHGYEYTADEIRDYGRAIRPHLGGHACVDVFDEEVAGGKMVTFDEPDFDFQDIIDSVAKIKWS